MNMLHRWFDSGQGADVEHDGMMSTVSNEKDSFKPVSVFLKQGRPILDNMAYPI